MTKIVRLLKYIALIPLRILYLPRIYRRLVALEATHQDLQRRMLTVEETIRATHPDLQRRMLTVEETIRTTHPDLQRRMLTAETAIRTTHPDLQRRMLIVEDNIRSLNPEEHTRMFNEARHEYYIAETMQKALAANLRDSVQAVAEIKAKQEVLENMKDLGQKNLDLVKLHEAGLAASIRDLTRDVKRLKEILAAKEAENGRKEQ